MSNSLLQRLGLTRLSDYLRLEEESHERELECYMLEMECEELRRNVKRLEEAVARLTPKEEVEKVAEGDAFCSVDNLLTARKIRLERRVKPEGVEVSNSPKSGGATREAQRQVVTKTKTKKETNKATIKKGATKTTKK